MVAKDSGPFQQKLAAMVVISGIVVSGLCAAIAIGTAAASNTTADAAKQILALLLPVIGTWIGTVLAFYFGRENFEAGAQQTRLALGERLHARALDVAIGVDKIKSIEAADDAGARQLALDAIDAHLAKIGFSRTPIFTAGKLPLYVVHRQPLDTFMASLARAGRNVVGLKLDDLLKAPEGQPVVASFVVVPEAATLAEAKAAMESRKDCQDVFITRTGKADAPVIAWLTNNEIQRAASG